MKLPELLAPAGNLEKLHIAFRYGADAVYVGINAFGLRKYADNFTYDELAIGIALANSLNKQVYVVLNGFAHQEDLIELETVLPILNSIRPHAFIISDIGVLQMAKRLAPDVALHASTQASICSVETCQFWKDAGAKRVILGRETSLEECKIIKSKLDIELEIFVHGAMCASYSGKCVISNYTSGRDSNRGGCVQSCRHAYTLFEGQVSTEENVYIMNAKDLQGIDLIPEVIDANIESLKIEGRMKSNLYVANAVAAYRKAIDDALCKNQSTESVSNLQNQLKKVSNRTFSHGGLSHRPGSESIAYWFGGYEKSLDFIGTVKAVTADKTLIVDTKAKFSPQEPLLWIKPKLESQFWAPEAIYSMTDEPLESTKPNSLIKLKSPGHNIEAYDILARVL